MSYLKCNYCFKNFGAGAPFKTAFEQRKSARRNGWMRGKKGEDYCEECVIKYPHLNIKYNATSTRIKIGDLLYDVRYWLPVCRACHQKCHDHPQWAYDNGYSLKRLEEPTV